MLQKSTLAVILVAIFVAFSASASDVIQLGPTATTVEMSQNDRGDSVIQVTVSEVRLDVIEIDGQRWAAPRVPDGSNLMERGLPAIPFLENQYLLDRTDGIELRLTGVVTTEIDLDAHDFVGIAPSKGHFDRSIDPESVPWTFDPEVYGGEKDFPAVDVWVDSPTIAGPWRAQAFRVPIATWNAVTNILTVIEEATFEIVAVADAANPRIGPDHAPTALFGSMRGAVNAASSRDTRSAEAGRLLILAYDDFVDEVQPLADWETLVGYPTLLTPLSTVAPTPTPTEIMAYIQGLYDEPEGLAWIILVGDYQQIPNPPGVNEGADCDPCYTKLEGADNRPDASISRISAQNGADVTIQVDKILHYEQQPDTGGAATWYDHAFGVAGDDSGGSPSYTDWERMNFLRDDLLQPAYTYSEFDELYHYPSTTEVKTSIEDGTSLGLYIGHGSVTAWSTSGFSVTDVHGLVNGEMLPLIWSVACVNGAFNDANECFAESWLRREGGGAVSFEGATTNESWVPPCDAQRGVVDAIRLETDFTAGAQHVAGKIACMNIWGDNDSSEGNLFMEQSTLFGSSVLWPRTVEPSAIDLPDNFNVAGGTATLTVSVGGSPLTKAGGAIVNFYTTDGVSITSVGSGLIDATGTVQAAVTGEPTHCHIHGHNLVPQSFELAAQDDGRVNLDGAVYNCSSTAGIRVADANVPGSTGGAIDTLIVDVSAGGAPVAVVLTETGADTNFYDGTVVLGTDLAVSDGDTLTVTYEDADTGAGAQTKTATATLDCLPPGIGAVETSADHESLTISYFTDEPGTTLVRWGTTTPPINVVSDDALVDGTHTVTIEGLDPCARIFFEVGSTDAAGNTTLDTNGGAWYSADTLGWAFYLEETMDADPLWAIDNGGNSHGWAFGVPQGAGGQYGGPDPTSGFTGDNVYGVNLAGDYDNNLANDQLKLTTPAIDLSEATAVQLSYRRWLGVESPTYDHARVQVSTNGGASWSTVWENDSEVADSAWSEHTIDLTSIAAGQADFRVRWTQGSTDGSWQYSGWNIDDVRLEGSAPCGGIGSIFVDGFESGGTSAWSMTSP
ncbi:MAG: C25 family cysteine peptidase [Acidobacteriota bacterium]